MHISQPFPPDEGAALFARVAHLVRHYFESDPYLCFPGPSGDWHCQLNHDPGAPFTASARLFLRSPPDYNPPTNSSTSPTTMDWDGSGATCVFRNTFRGGLDGPALLQLSRLAEQLFSPSSSLATSASVVISNIEIAISKDGIAKRAVASVRDQPAVHPAQSSPSACASAPEAGGAKRKLGDGSKRQAAITAEKKARMQLRVSELSDFDMFGDLGQRSKHVHAARPKEDRSEDVHVVTLPPSESLRASEVETNEPLAAVRQKSGVRLLLRTIRNPGALAQAEREGMTVLLSRSKSGLRGVHAAPNVCRDSGILHWQAAIKDGGGVRILGYFRTPEEAALCYARFCKQNGVGAGRPSHIGGIIDTSASKEPMRHGEATAEANDPAPAEGCTSIACEAGTLPRGTMTAEQALSAATTEGLRLERGKSNQTGYLNVRQVASVRGGVTFHAHYGGHFLGEFATAEEAALVRARAAVEYESDSNEDGADIDVGQDEPRAKACGELPRGWERLECVSSTGKSYLRYTSADGRRAQSVPEAWRIHHAAHPGCSVDQKAALLGGGGVNAGGRVQHPMRPRLAPRDRTVRALAPALRSPPKRIIPPMHPLLPPLPFPTIPPSVTSHIPARLLTGRSDGRQRQG